MRPRRMVIFLDVLFDQAIAILIVDRNNMVQEFSTQSPEEALDEWILPGTVIGGTDFLNPTPIQEGTDTVAIDPVIVPEHESRLPIERHGFLELKDDPFHAGKSGNVKVGNLAP